MVHIALDPKKLPTVIVDYICTFILGRYPAEALVRVNVPLPPPTPPPQKKRKEPATRIQPPRDAKKHVNYKE